MVGAALLPACVRRDKREVNPIVPGFQINRPRAPLGSAVEITYTWTVEAGAKKVPENYRAFVGFVDSHGVLLFEDDHVPVPRPSAWEPQQTYTYTRTKFIPIYPYVGPVEIRMGLYKERDRLTLKGEDAGLRAYRVGKIELLPQTENIFLVYKDGWHSPESSAANPSQERTWTKKEALVSFKNPKKDVIVYLEADTNFKAFPRQPVLIVSVNGKTGITVPIEDSEVFLKKIRVKAADLGAEDWVDLRLAMNQSFIPKLLTPPINGDDRELGLLVYHLSVADAGQVGELPAGQTVEAGPLPASALKGAPAGKGGPAVKPAPAKPAPAPAKPAPKPKKPQG